MCGIVGCGTAYHAGILAGYYIEQFTPETTIEPVIASEYRYRQAYIPKDSVALIVSQSGETADTLARGGHVTVITCQRLQC